MRSFRERRFFPERRYKLRLRWVMWGAVGILLVGLVLFVRFIFR